MNNYDQSLTFTIKEMKIENKLVFLDMVIFLDDNKSLEFIKYRKNSTNTVITNFERSIVSKNIQKRGL
jgi:hypothetical protein